MGDGTRRVLFGTLEVVLFVAVFAVVAFAFTWALPLRQAAAPDLSETPRTCEGECEIPAADDADGGPTWRQSKLWGSLGDPDLSSLPGFANAEPVAKFAPQSRVRRAAASVGRVQLLLEANGRFVKTACTGTLISAESVLTAAHCARLAGSNAAPTIKLAAIRFGLLTQTASGEGALFDLDPDHVEVQYAPADPSSDFLVLHFKDNATADAARAAGVQPVTLSAARAQAGSDLYVIGHPLGVAQIVLRADCRGRSTEKEVEAAAVIIPHTCGTAPGLSGAPIFDDLSGAMIGIHTQAQDKAQKDAADYGYGVPLAEIAKRSPTLRALLQASTSGAQQ